MTGMEWGRAAVTENKVAQECGDFSPLIFRAKELYFN
jgi:hypothetical protein